MKIAVLGTGVVAQTISEKLNALGHEVMLGTRDVKNTLSRSGPDSFGRPPFAEWHDRFKEIKLGTYTEAAVFGEFIVNATNGVGTLAALEQAGKKNLANKIMLDIANPLDFSKGMPPSLTICNTDSLGEQIQRNYPETKVVKSLNTMNAYIMVNPGLLPEDHTVFLNGDDESAKTKVKELLQSFGWKEKNMIDMGDITTARGTEQLLPIWVRLWGALQNPMFNFKIVIGSPPQM
ncbi:MAG: NAD(P)-binding domain-containing protein [Saprospiraceae bacterium]